MKWYPLALLTLAAVWAGEATPARAQHKVRYYDRAGKKEAQVAGTVTREAPAGITVVSSTKVTTEVAALDILDVVYELPPRFSLDYGRAQTQERNLAAGTGDVEKTLTELTATYNDLQGKVAGDPLKLARRHLQFKHAYFLARQAQESEALVPAALEALKKFRAEHPDSWQLIAATRLLAQLQLDARDAEGAEKTYLELSRVPGLPKEVRQESDLMVAQALIRGKKYAEAEKRLQEILQGASGGDPVAQRAQVYLAQCAAGTNKFDDAVKQLEDLIARAASPELKAAAYNALGDSYTLKGRTKDALWCHLWVDVVYNQDRQEHLKAVKALAELFKELGDAGREKQYRDKLKREGK